MFKISLTLLLLSQPLLLANSRLEQLKTEAMTGNKQAVLSLTDAYFHGNIKGIPQDYRQSYIWGTVYMALDPNFGRGIERITIFSEQELFAQQRLTNAQLGSLTSEAQRIAKEIKGAKNGSSGNSAHDGKQKLDSIPKRFRGTWTPSPNHIHPPDGELPLVIRAKKVAGHEWGGQAVSITRNGPGDISVVIKGESEAMSYQSKERWVIGKGGQTLKITNLGQSSFSRTVYRVRP